MCNSSHTISPDTSERKVPPTGSSLFPATQKYLTVSFPSIWPRTVMRWKGWQDSDFLLSAQVLMKGLCISQEHLKLSYTDSGHWSASSELSTMQLLAATSLKLPTEIFLTNGKHVTKAIQIPSIVHCFGQCRPIAAVDPSCAFLSYVNLEMPEVESGAISMQSRYSTTWAFPKLSKYYW